jgi:hypothetical protein
MVCDVSVVTGDEKTKVGDTIVGSFQLWVTSRRLTCSMRLLRPALFP